MPSISPDEERHFVQIGCTLCAFSSSGGQPGAEQDGELEPLHFCGRVLLTGPYEPLSYPKHMYFLNQYSSHANSFQINPMVKWAWIEAVLHDFHCQHFIPTLPPRSLLLLESSRHPVDTAQTQELSRKLVATTPPLWRTNRRQLEELPKGLTATISITDN